QMAGVLCRYAAAGGQYWFGVADGNNVRLRRTFPREIPTSSFSLRLDLWQDVRLAVEAKWFFLSRHIRRIHDCDPAATHRCYHQRIGWGDVLFDWRPQDAVWALSRDIRGERVHGARFGETSK